MKSVPLISLTIQHHQTQEEARRRLATAVHEISTKLGAMLRHVEWAADRNRVKLAPMLSRLLGGPLGSRLKQIVERTFQKQLPR